MAKRLQHPPTDTAAECRVLRNHLARVLATIDPSGSNADALQVDHVLDYLTKHADRLDAAAVEVAEADLLAAEAAEAATLAVDEELGDLYWTAYVAAECGPLHLTGIRAVRERLALVAEWLIAEAEQKGVASGLAAFDSRPATPRMWPDSPRVWDDIGDVPHNVRATDRYRTEWRWDMGWEWFSVITGGWIIAGFSERTDFAPFTEVL